MEEAYFCCKIFQRGQPIGPIHLRSQSQLQALKKSLMLHTLNSISSNYLHNRSEGYQTMDIMRRRGILWLICKMDGHSAIMFRISHLFTWMKWATLGRATQSRLKILRKEMNQQTITVKIVPILSGSLPCTNNTRQKGTYS